MRYGLLVQPRRVVALIVAIIGLLALVVGLIYLNVSAESLPSFFPGHLVGVRAKHGNRGGAGIALGIVLLVIGGYFLRQRRSPYPR